MKVPSHKRFIADVKSGEARELKPQSRFRFACQCCGECCRRDVNILLNPYDIFRATRYLKITTTEFFTRYATQYIGPDSGMPLAILEHTQAGHCVFLKGNRCSVWCERPWIPRRVQAQ
jgi:Fe-S-cluster containining protein